MPLALAMLRESPGLWPVWAAAPRTNAGVINEGVIRPADRQVFKLFFEILLWPKIGPQGVFWDEKERNRRRKRQRI